MEKYEKSDNMNGILCSKGFLRFFCALQKNVSGMDELLQHVAEEIPYLLEEFPIGRLVLLVQSSPSVYDMNGINEEIELYVSEDGCQEDEPWKETFQIQKHGSISVIAYPPRNVRWNREEKETMFFLAENIFVIFSRARVSGLLEKAVVTDNCTGVLNLQGFFQQGEKKIASHQLQNYVAGFCNIKNFKYVNNQIGQQYGDAMRKQYAHRILHWLKKDEIVARLGGDNFVVLIRKERIQEFITFIHGFRVRMKAQNRVKEYDILSRIGLYEIQPDDSMQEVMNGISVAIHATKEQRNHEDVVWYSHSMLEKDMWIKEISIMFPRALKAQEFVVHYQPKVDLQSGEMCGCEALVRWQRGEKRIPPMEFIPILERQGTICELDFYVLEEVCRNIKKWRGQGIDPVNVSVNFSKEHMRREDFAERIIKIVNQYDVDTKYLEVELTEMSEYEDYQSFVNFVHKMHEVGIRTSIDDFGTGYSSLYLLMDLDVDVIKLDKAFLDEVVEDSSGKNKVVVKNIVNMVKELRLEVLAEGVETEEQAEFLKEVQCKMAQGYLFGKPLCLDEFEKILADK